MRVALRKTSLVDFPGRVAATLFFPFCGLRCPWCHNGALLKGGEAAADTELDAALAFLEKRRSVLGGVVLSGGEPLLYSGLAETIRHIKTLGLLVKLDTNGMHPLELEALLGDASARPDYIALDLKLAPDRYAALGAADGGKRLERSAAALADSGADGEYRSLALPGGRFGDPDIAALAPLARRLPWYFGSFRSGGCLDEAWDEYPSEPVSRAENLARKARALGADARARA